MSSDIILLKKDMEGGRNIPDDVLFDEILARLPVKSLTRYKSVSQKWLHTIESNSFVDLHRLRHFRNCSNQILVFSPFIHVSDPVTKSSSLLPCSTPPSLPASLNTTSTPLNAMLPFESTRIQWPYDMDRADWNWKVKVTVLGPVKATGIYCVVATLLNGFFPHTKITLCNPSAKSYKLANPLPPEELARLSDLTTSHCFVVGSYGFGLAADGDYKVVAVLNWDTTGTNFVSFVYSLKKGEWKKIVDSTAGMVSPLHFGGEQSYYYPEVGSLSNEICPQAFVNGCWHWTAMLRDQYPTGVMLSFDLDNEVFKVFSGPQVVALLRMYRIVSVLNGHLAALYSNRYSNYISVWMMMEYGDDESWVNVWRVDGCYYVDALVGISYSLREDGNEDRNGGIHIHKILYQDYKDLVSCDESGVAEKQSGFDISSYVFWNNIGMSTYS